MAILKSFRDFGPRVGALGLLVSCLAGVAVPSHAADVFVGVYDHALFAAKGQEGGEDIMLGYRTAPMRGWTWLARPEIHVMVSANTQTSTDFVAVGLDWPLTLGFGGRLYVRPGFGLAYTTGEADIGNAFAPGLTQEEHDRRLYLSQTRIDFGSKEQFEPELAFGYKLTPRIAVEASYVHLSNGQIFHQGKNQGLDDAGLRVAYSF
jgi:lipid A 3-O-deacylase